MQQPLTYGPELDVGPELPLMCREEEKRLAAASQPDVHSLLTPTSRNRQGGTGGGLVSARRRVANQRDSKDSLPSIVGSNRGHHEKDTAGSESGASHTHHLPGPHHILLTDLEPGQSSDLQADLFTCSYLMHSSALRLVCDKSTAIPHVGLKATFVTVPLPVPLQSVRSRLCCFAGASQCTTGCMMLRLLASLKL